MSSSPAPPPPPSPGRNPSAHAEAVRRARRTPFRCWLLGHDLSLVDDDRPEVYVCLRRPCRGRTVLHVVAGIAYRLEPDAGPIARTR